MKALFKISFQNLKENKQRTLFTCFSIILSVFLLSSLLIMQSTKSEFTLRQQRFLGGDYQVRLPEELKDNILSMVKEEQIKDIADFYMLGVVEYGNGSLTEVFTTTQPLKMQAVGILEGREPSNSTEVMISQDYANANGVRVGDTIELKISTLDAQDPMGEFIANEQTKVIPMKFTVTGLYMYYFAGTTFQNQSDTIITYGNDKNLPLNHNMSFVQFQDISKKEFERIRDTMKATGNDYLISQDGVEILFDEVNTLDPSTIFVFVILLLFLIQMTINVFRISFNERKVYLGVLKSIGSTTKQLYLISFFEALLYSLCSIPIGIGLSILVMNGYFDYLSQITSTILPFYYEYHPTILHVAGIVVFNFVFILISNLVPLWKVHKANSIDLIKGIEIQKTKKTQRTKETDHMELEISKRNRKRNRKGYFSIQNSILLSVILLLCSSYYYQESSSMIHKATTGYVLSYQNLETAEDLNLIEQAIDDITDLPATDHAILTISSGSFLFPQEYLDAKTRSVLWEPYHQEPQVLLSYDSSLGLEGNKAIANNTFYVLMDNKEKLEYRYFPFDEETELQFPYRIGHFGPQNEEDAPMIEVALTPKVMEEELYNEENLRAAIPVIYTTLEPFYQIVGLDFMSSHMNVYASDMDALETQLKEYKDTHPDLYFTIEEVHPINSDNGEKLFDYAIAVVLMFISVINLFCVMMTSIMLKGKEYALLESMGLENKQLLGLIFYESSISLWKGLCLGLPIGLIGCYLLYRYQLKFTEQFHIPWMMCLLCLLGILVLSLITTYLGYRKMKKLEITELLKES